MALTFISYISTYHVLYFGFSINVQYNSNFINSLIQGRGARGAAAGPQVPPFMGGEAQNFFAQWAAAVAAANNNNNNMNNNMNNVNNGGQRPPSASAAPQPTPGRSQSGATGGGATAATSTGPNTAAPAVGNPFLFPRPPPFPQVKRFATILYDI